MKMNESSSLKREENVTKNPTLISDLKEKKRLEEATQKEQMKQRCAVDALEEKKEETSEAGTNRKLIIAAIAVGTIVIMAIIVAVAFFGRSPKEEQVQKNKLVQEDVSVEATTKEEVAVNETSIEAQKSEKETSEAETEQVSEETQEEIAVKEEMEAISYDGIDMESTLPGVEWIETTFPEVIDTPKLVLFNDETNKKVIVENGQEVEFERNDQLAIYSPEGRDSITEYDYKTFSTMYMHEYLELLQGIDDFVWKKKEVESTNVVMFNGEEQTLTCTLKFVE